MRICPCKKGQKTYLWNLKQRFLVDCQIQKIRILEATK